MNPKTQTRTAICIWTVLVLCASCLSFANTAHGEDIYGGVEIGSKGVKWIVSKDDAKSFTEKKVKPEDVKRDTQDVGLVAAGFSPEAVDFAIEAVKIGIEELKKANVPDDHISIVASSGLVGQAKKSENGKTALARLKGEFEKLDELTPQREVTLMFLGIVPTNEQKTALMIDIGSGNTKFGAFDGGELIVGEVQTATGTVSKEFVQAMQKEGADREAILAGLKDRFTSDLKTALKAFPKRKYSKVYLSGGIIWAMVNFEQPQDFPKRPNVTVNRNSFASFHKRVLGEKIEFAAGGEQSPELRKELSVIQEVFPHETLQAGSVLTDSLFDVLFDGADSPVAANASLVFDRNSLYSWIRGYVNAAKPGPSVSQLEEFEGRLRRMQVQLETLQDQLKQRPQSTDPELAVTVKSGLENIRKEIQNQKPVAAPSSAVDLTPVVDAVNGLKASIEKQQKPAAPRKQSTESGTSTKPVTGVRPKVSVQDGWAAFHHGRDTYWAGDKPRALSLFREATSLAPNEPVIWYYRALSELACKETLDAEASANRCAQLVKTDAQLSELCRGLERVQGCPRQMIDRLLEHGRLSESGLTASSR